MLARFLTGLGAIVLDLFTYLGELVVLAAEYLTMSQWMELRFVPPVTAYELPTARCTVPSIFSSKATFFM